MGPRRPRAVALDAGALIAFEKNDRKLRTLVELALLHGAPLHTTGAVVAQVWRHGSRQARLARLLGSGVVRVQAIDREEGQAIGALCGKSGTRDVVDASVALVARRHGAVVVTSDVADVQRIDPGTTLSSVDGRASNTFAMRRGTRERASSTRSIAARMNLRVS